MTSNETFGQILSSWLTEDAEHRVPDHLGDVLVRTVATRQRPWWSSPERWLPMGLSTRANALNPLPFGRVILVAALVVALLGLVLYAVGTRQQRLPAPFGPATNGSIVYSTGGDISIVDPIDGTARIIVGGPTTDVGPIHSHDGTRVAFLRLASGNALRYMAIGADGGDLKVLTPDPLEAPDQWDWSPDGTSLVVLHTVDEQRVVSIVPTDGSGAIRRLDLGAIVPDEPAWRPPDGREIVFRGTTDGGATAGIYGIRPDGSGLHALTPMADKDDFANPRLSPDGDAIAYWNLESDESSVGTVGRTHVLDLRSGDDRLIGHDLTTDHEVSPRFSPDGSQVLFIRYGLNVPARLMIAPADGSGPASQVGPDLDADGNFFFEFSPDGQKILLADRLAASSQVIDIDDGSVRSGAGIDDWATWQRLAAPAD
jgi:Tol biopolymer transport system component